MAKKATDSLRSNIVPFAVHVNGKLDLAGTQAKFLHACEQYIGQTEAEETIILEALNELFDTHLGARFNQQAITGNVVRMIQSNVPALNSVSLYTQLSNRVLEVLHAEIEAGRYASKKGAGSAGTYRVCDQTETE